MEILGLNASIRILGANTEIKCVETLRISLEPADLATGIQCFAGKIHTAICDALYEIQGQNGRINNTICLDVTTCGGDLLGYRENILAEPSKELWEEVAAKADKVVNELTRDLAHSIIYHPQFQTQRISRRPSVQRK